MLSHHVSITFLARSTSLWICILVHLAQIALLCDLVVEWCPGGVHITAAGPDRARLHTAGVAEIRRAEPGFLSSILHAAQVEGPDRALQPSPRAAGGHVPKDATPMDGSLR